MRLHRRTMIKHAIWGVFESVVRVGGPLLLREFLKVLEQGVSQPLPTLQTPNTSSRCFEALSQK
jgi:hypothetical protein